MAEQWQYNKLLSMRNRFNYQVVQEDVYIDGKHVGDVRYLASLDTQKMIKEVETKLALEKKGLKMADQEVVERRATRDGEMVAEFLLAISPKAGSIPQSSLWWMMTRIGEAFGYSDIHSNDAFKYGVMNKMSTYTQANARVLELETGE